MEFILGVEKMFCPKCGVQSPDGSNFCNGCGVVISKVEMDEGLNQAVQMPIRPNYNYEQPQQPYQPYVQPYYAPTCAKPRRPGKGLGISSMILGILGAIYSSMLSLIALQTILYSFAHDSGEMDLYKNMKITAANFFDSDNMENITSAVFACLVCAVLALIFAIVSKNKGFRNKISKSGFVLSIVSVVLVFVFILFAGYAYSDSPSKDAIPTDQLIGAWVTTDEVSSVTFEHIVSP